MARDLAFVLLVLAALAVFSSATKLTIHNLCPHPSCRAPGELKIVLCQSSMLQCGAAAAEDADMVIRTVVADN
ncbi:unnamed protein product [Triticum turgidum subsp. durum]|uniref:Acidic protein n=1 Tax=Triticum turgidum subsp. durum TaxID=4567 RepID=A0A9R0X1E7_TRITD|nr:unnamed protein product [Triticum turgidum subsp. durum]